MYDCVVRLIQLIEAYQQYLFQSSFFPEPLVDRTRTMLAAIRDLLKNCKIHILTQLLHGSSLFYDAWKAALFQLKIRASK
jgi:hypothetical protein